MRFVLWLRSYDWSFYRELGLRGDSRLYVLHAREHTQAEYRWIEMFGHGKQ